jgi:hypothetical protein
LILRCVLLLEKSLDPLVTSLCFVDKLSEACRILGLLLLAGVVVLSLSVTLLITAFVVIGDILILVLEGPP